MSSQDIYLLRLIVLIYNNPKVRLKTAKRQDVLDEMEAIQM